MPVNFVSLKLKCLNVRSWGVLIVMRSALRQTYPRLGPVLEWLVENHHLHVTLSQATLSPRAACWLGEPGQNFPPCSLRGSYYAPCGAPPLHPWPPSGSFQNSSTFGTRHTHTEFLHMALVTPILTLSSPLLSTSRAFSHMQNERITLSSQCWTGAYLYFLTLHVTDFRKKKQVYMYTFSSHWPTRVSRTRL